MLSNLLQKFEALNSREKWLIIAALVAGLWLCWDTFFYTPFRQGQTEVKQHLTELETQLTAQQQVAIQLQSRSYTDPNSNTKKQLSELKAQYKSLQQQMRRLDKKFVPPALMAKVLSDLLKQNNQLTLINFQTLPVTTLPESNLIYQHGLVLQFSGSYLATLKYLQALEAMPWNFIWESIDYQVKTYPLAEITLRVYTLSLEKDWLDV